MTKAVVLGSAAGGGFPQWNCGCDNCQLAWARDPRAVWRTQSSIAIVADHTCVLINASPDIGQQIRATTDLWPRSWRHSPVSTVVLTSAEIDNTAGLLSLRENHAFDIFALAPVREAVAENPLLQPLTATWVGVEAGKPRPIDAGLDVTLFPVPGKAPLYLEGDEPRSASDSGETAGLAVAGPNASLVYIPGCAELNDEVRRRAEGANIVLFDGTLYDDEEMRRAHLGIKTGRRMGHMPMTGPGGSLDWLAALPASRKMYIHINNTNPVLIEGSRERRRVEGAGVEIAHDGLEITL
jgi:pyrroloquinoline quinone biosynthesis protein B